MSTDNVGGWPRTPPADRRSEISLFRAPHRAMLVAASSLAGAVLWSVAPAQAPPSYTCENPLVTIRSSVVADNQTACDGAQDALAFLMSYGLRAPREIVVELVPKVSDHVSASAAGCYLESEHRVLMLEYAELGKQGEWFGLPLSRRLYRSLVTHEVAHAVAACNFRIREPSISAKEYIAYVVMLATMDSSQRQSLHARYPGEGFEGDWQMSTTIYLLDPMRFGVQAYRHFLKPGNGRAYLQAILAGDALADDR